MSKASTSPRHIGAVLDRFRNQNDQPKVNQDAPVAKRPMIRYTYPEGTLLYSQPVIKSRGLENDMAVMLKRYRKHVQAYNEQVEIMNTPIKEYNKSIRENRKRLRLSITPEQRFKEDTWKREHKKLSPQEYNAMAVRYNKQHGSFMYKVVLRQPVQPVTEQYFAAFMYQYQHQINLHSRARRVPPLLNTLEPLPRLKIYPNKIQETEQDGYKKLDKTAKTIRAHRDRLEEAGVLKNIQFHGRERAVSARVHPDILQVRDNKLEAPQVFTLKNATAVNQEVKNSQENLVPHSNVSSSGQSLVKNKYRVEGVFSEKEKTTQCAAHASTGSPKMQDAKNHDTPDGHRETLQKKLTKGRAISSKKQRLVDKNPLSAVLADGIDDRRQLCADLSEGKYNAYKELEHNIVQQEAYYGVMHPQDFIELAIQDLFKTAAVLFIGLDSIHPGSWMNAYKIWMADKFTSFTGKNLSKPNTYERWMKCRTILVKISAFAKAHPDWNPTYPSLYFDTTRTFKENNSFEYAYRFFRIDEEEIPKAAARKIDASKDAILKTDVKKARQKIVQYLYNHCDLQEVYDYANNNLSKKVAANINLLITRERELLMKNYKA